MCVCVCDDVAMYDVYVVLCMLFVVDCVVYGVVIGDICECGVVVDSCMLVLLVSMPLYCICL